MTTVLPSLHRLYVNVRYPFAMAFDALVHMAGYDWAIERDDPPAGLLDIKVDRKPGAFEFWGLGLHLMVDKLPPRYNR